MKPIYRYLVEYTSPSGNQKWEYHYSFRKGKESFTYHSRTPNVTNVRLLKMNEQKHEIELLLPLNKKARPFPSHKNIFGI
jgi:hypothetical protein